MAARGRFLKLESWIRGHTTFDRASRFDRLRERWVTDFLGFERAEKYWGTQLQLLAQVFGSLPDGVKQLASAAVSFSEAVYPWTAYERWNEEEMDPRLKARRERDRVMTGTDELFELYEKMVDSGELPGGEGYAEWKTRRVAQRDAMKKAAAEEKSDA